jgi:hypothetical protein
MNIFIKSNIKDYKDNYKNKRIIFYNYKKKHIKFQIKLNKFRELLLMLKI